MFSKVLLLGSGALKIGEAGEFDYSGSQAIKAYKEEGMDIVIVNPNIATHQTSWGLASAVYFLPVTPEFVSKVIESERPEAIALSFGGQTALNCGIALEDAGILKKYNVAVLGTTVESIRATEDRKLFKEALEKIGVKVPRSFPCVTEEEALERASKLRYPVIVRGAFALGGKGSGRAKDAAELRAILRKTFSESPQALIEEDLTGWKEIEYEVVRDRADNVITVCNMENIDPMGIHTGESIVVAPSQTLDNAEYQMLRTVALRVIRHFQIIGECNIQYALDPHSRDYRVIEVNARLSRSSALASKATGYPLAFIAAKLGLGYTLPELRNSITQVTSADFEPALDYIALKVPRWDLQKFRFASDTVTSEMKSVGEVMALGRSFEEVLQKAIRMLRIDAEGICHHPFSFEELEDEVSCPTPRRIFAVAEALRQGWEVRRVAERTGIDPWFLQRIKMCCALEEELRKENTRRHILPPETLRKLKQAGFSDQAIATSLRMKAEDIRSERRKLGITPIVKQIDTLACEFPARTNYLYMTYHGTESDTAFGNSKFEIRNSKFENYRVKRHVGRRHAAFTGKLQTTNSPKRVLVLGSGPYSIGSSVEFDWCCVEAAKELQAQGLEVSMVNSNPETVSTDYDECDNLFFEELSEERIRDIAELVQPEGVVVSMGGQIPNSLAPKLATAGIPTFGTDPKDIDRAEDRHKFSALLDELHIDQPAWKEFSSYEAARAFGEEVGYPIIVRPSYVLSGAAMAVVHSGDDLQSYLDHAATVSKEAPVVISKFEVNAKEIDFDGIAQEGKLLLYALSEHVENAGVHSGDATLVLPPQRINLETLRRSKAIAKSIAKALRISGPFNIQLLAKANRLKVIECNLRASRSFPFVSKVTGVNFAKLATQALLQRAPMDVRYQTVDLDHVAVKAAQFSFSRLHGADPRLGVEMSSTGEVACFGHTAEQALLLSLLAVGFRMPQQSILLTIGNLEDKIELLPSIQVLHGKGFTFLATKRTHAFLAERGIPSLLLHKVSEKRGPNIADYIQDRKVDLVINIPTHGSTQERTDGYLIRRLAADLSIPLITNVQLTKRFVEALSQEDLSKLPLLRWPDLLGPSLTPYTPSDVAHNHRRV